MWQGVTQTKGAPNTESNRTILGTICSLSTENNMGPRPLQTSSSSNSNGKSMNNKLRPLNVHVFSRTGTYKSCTITVQVQKVSPKVLVLQGTTSPNFQHFFHVSTETSTKKKKQKFLAKFYFN